MQRRGFLKKLGISFGISANLSALLMGNSLFANQVNTNVSEAINATKHKIFILIQLVGGNDGLNTVVPLNQYENLYLHRKNILLKEKSLIKISDTLGFHPKIKELGEMFIDGKLGLIQNVGYELQNRSHFRSMDIWNSGSPYDEIWSTGWLGRYLDFYHASYPEKYPNTKFMDPLAINIGNIVADTCQGKSANYSYALDSLKNVQILKEHHLDDQIKNAEYLKELQFLYSTTSLSNNYTKRVELASSKGNNLFEYPDNNLLAQQLKMVAKLISGGLQTQFYTLTLGGFDTHAYQTTEKTEEGFHAVQLETLSQAIFAFQNDLVKLSLEDRVMGMTYSEFGRQIKSNSASGTDHGDAAPLFIFGNNIKHQIVGKNPIIQQEMEDQTGVSVEFDFRDVYASLLTDWFNSEQSVTKDIFKYQSLHIPFLKTVVL